MAKRSTNKSELIRQELTKHPEKSAMDIAKVLKVDASLVYQVKSKMKAKSGSAKRSKRKRREAVSSTAADGSVQGVIAAAKLIKSCGSIAEARQALKTAEQVVAALEN